MCADTNAGRTTGTLHRIHHSGEVETLRTHIGVTNGLAFDVTRNRMYFADTPTERVLVFDYEPSTGALSNQRLFFDYHEYPGKPDGACVDADGCYWSASVYGWALLRITPDGDVDCRIELPIQKPSVLAGLSHQKLGEMASNQVPRSLSKAWESKGSSSHDSPARPVEYDRPLPKPADLDREGLERQALRGLIPDRRRGNR
jgi:hypothetical protein